MDEIFGTWSHPARPASLWLDSAESWDFDPVQSGSAFDVVIIGAGFTGLWTAVHLLNRDPTLRIAILDAVQPGFGASGRNGGWCSAAAPMSLEYVAQLSSRQQAIDLQHALNDTVDQIGLFIQSHNIKCGWQKSGTLTFATIPAHLMHSENTVKSYRDFGFGDEQISVLNAEQAATRINVHGALGATYTPHCATIHPAQLVDGLVRYLLSRDVLFFGQSRVTSFGNGVVAAKTPHGPVSMQTEWAIRATEGFTAHLSHYRRAVAPIYSYMIATEPLSRDIWEQLGWNGRETFADARHSVIYAQRTPDDRIAFGGRGAPYKFASNINPKFDMNRAVHDRIEATMKQLFPAVADVEITHRWGGVLGAHRNWCTSVSVDPDARIAAAGGYVGDGVAFTHLAARAIADRITRTESTESRLFFNSVSSKKWEPEPLRWLGVNSLLRINSLSDIYERRRNKSSRFLEWIIGLFVK